MVLVNPGVVVPTVEIFRRLERRTGVAEKIPSGWGHNAHELVAYLADTMNDLEAPACALYPVIRDVLQAMAAQEGVLLARMSGSGATCFALFEDSQTAARAANAITALNTTWWVRTTRIASSDIGRPRPAI
jgi:4-diphosphocytidyl-2-C-methyl-D-erythritol kinase